MPEPTAHTETPAGHNQFPPFQTQNFPSQIVWLAFTFILLYVLMARIALPRIGSILAERSKRITDDIAAARALKEQSDAAHAAYEKALADARARAQSIAAGTREREAAAAEETNKRLEAQLHERLAAAEKSIAATRTAAMGNVGGIATATAGAIVERLIGVKPAVHEVAAAVGDVVGAEEFTDACTGNLGRHRLYQLPRTPRLSRRAPQDHRLAGPAPGPHPIRARRKRAGCARRHRPCSPNSSAKG